LLKRAKGHITGIEKFVAMSTNTFFLFSSATCLVGAAFVSSDSAAA
jgi:hypothetical protein